MNQDLTGALRSAASSIDIPEGDLEGLIVTARRRNRNKRRMGTVFTSIVLLVALVVTISVADRSDNPTTLKVGDGIEEPKGPAEALDWQLQDVSQLGQVNGSGIVEVSDRLYAISTGPGETKVPSPSVIWRSDDAVNWSPLPIFNSSPTNYFSDIIARGDRLYAAGTIPADVKTTIGKKTYSPVVAWSDDEAKTWEHVQLPVDMADIAAHSLYTSTYVNLASDSKNVLAAVVVSSSPNLKSLLPDGADYSNGWALSPQGIDLLKPGPGGPCPEGSFPNVEAPPRPVENDFPLRAPCYTTTEITDASGKVIGSSGLMGAVPAQDYYGVEASYSWEQLGVKGDLLTAFTNQTSLFRISDDGSVTKLEGPKIDDPSNSNSTQLVGSPDAGFAVAIGGLPGGSRALFTSNDGTDWVRKEDMPSQQVPFMGPLGTFGKGFGLVGLSFSADDSQLGSLIMTYEEPTGWTSIRVGQMPEGGPSGPLNTMSDFEPSGAVVVSQTSAEKPRSIISARRGENAFTSYVLEDITGLEGLHSAQQVFATKNGAIIFVRVENPDGKSGRRVAVIGTYRKDS